MTIALRGHHLLCMLTYIGKGYTQEFTRNYDRIALRISKGEALEIVLGSDDICRPLLSDAGAHCEGRPVLKRDERALAIVSSILDRPVTIGTVLKPDANMMETLRLAFADGQMRKACFGCEWASFCANVAKNAFRDAKIACPQ